jgi:hypothetical protein
LPKNLRKEITRAELSLIGRLILGRLMSTNPIDLLGYKISFMSKKEFIYLFYEVFVGASYFFQAVKVAGLRFQSVAIGTRALSPPSLTADIGVSSND